MKNNLKAVYFKDLLLKLFSFWVLSLLTISGIAQPQYYNSTYVGGSNAIPFNPNAATTFQRAQFVWGPGNFTGATAGAISKVYFYAASAAATTSTYNNFIVKLGQSNTNPLSTTAWFVTGMQTALSSTSYSITAAANTWAAITLTTPIAYDPTKFLVIDISSTGTSVGSFTINQQPVTGLSPGRNYGTAAATAPSGGDANTPDFGFDLLKSKDDVSITALVSPSSPCGATVDPFVVRIANVGSNVIAANQSINVGATLTGLVSATYLKKFNRALAIGASDTVHLGTLTNTDVMNGNIGIKAWCRFTSDTAFRNDTLKTNFFMSGSPGPPNPKDVTRCGGGSARLTAGVPSNSVGVWYNSNTSTIALGTDSVFYTPFLYPGVSTFYVESGRLSGTKTMTTGIGPGGTWFGAANPGGNMFNVVVNKTIKIDSIALNLNTTSNVTVSVYVKAGTYVGSQANASAWTLIKQQTVAGKGVGKETRVSMDGYTVPIGTYGVYIQTSQGIWWTAGAATFAGPDFNIITGDAVINLFGTVTANQAWSGNVYYRTVCTGARRPVVVTVKPSPYGASFIKGTLFQTTQPGTIGSPGNPDIVAKGDMLTYEITPPTGFSNSGYGTTWIMTDFTIKTKSGRVLTSAYYTPTNPSPTGSVNAKVAFTADGALADSTLIMTISIKDLGPHFCDSTLTRYIFVAPRPVPDFKFIQPVCDGDNVTFTNQSKISSGNLFYKWDFATGNPGDTSNNGDIVFTFPRHGIFNVVLTATSFPYGYSESKIIPVTVTEVPKIGFKVFNACFGDSVSFVNSTTISTGTITYKWNLGNGATSTKVSPKQKYPLAGSYKVTLTATSNGCSETLTKNAWEFARPVAKFTVPSVLCDKTDIQLTNGSIITSGNMGYKWTFSDGGVSTFTNPMHTFSTPGTKTVKMKAISEFGCADSITQSITLAEAPLADFTHSNVCNLSNTQFNFTGTKPGAGVTTVFNWDFGGEGTTSVESPGKKLSIIGKKLITLTLTSNNGCSDKIVKEVNVKLQSKADFSVSDVCDGENAVFTNHSTVSSGNLNYLWKFGDGAISNIPSPRHLYTGISQTFNVTLVAIVPGGCSDSVTKPVSLNPSPDASFTFTTSGRLVSFKATQAGNTTYHWSFGDGATADIMNTQYHYLNSFEYGNFNACLSVTNAAGCFSQTCQQVVISGGIDQLSKFNGVKIYPNPNQGNFIIKVEDPQPDILITVYNVLGTVIKTIGGDQLTSEYQVNLNTATGVYFVRVANGGLITTQMITINH